MADSKISALSEATSLATTDELVIATGGATKKTTYATLLASVLADGWVPAGETWTYAAADDPTYTFTISGVDKTSKYSAGMRVRLSQSTGGTKYGIITKVAFSTNTTVTLYMGTDYDLANEAISSPCYSVMKAPFGFPLDPTKWTVEATDSTLRSQSSPTQNTWYNLGSFSISIPIGCWNVDYKVFGQTAKVGQSTLQVTLSTANNSDSDSVFMQEAFPSSADNWGIQFARSKVLNLTSKTTYYLNTRTTTASVTTIYNRGDESGPNYIRAVCAYL